MDGWAFNVDGNQIRLNDLTLASVLRILEGDKATDEAVMQLLAQPLNNFERAVRIARECASVAGIEDVDAWMDVHLSGSWLDFTKLFVPVEDDLPPMVVDGNPQAGDDGSTAG